MQNEAIGQDTTWTQDGLTYTEMVRQPYLNCIYSAGKVEGHPVDTLYLRMQRDDDNYLFVLRPDEAAALAWCLTGALYSELIVNVEERE